jgi:hypothetical protein
LEAHVILFQQALDKSSTVISEEARSHAVATYKDFLQSDWTKDAMFMNYLEGKQFATSVANIVVSGRELQQDELQRILTQQASVMTARGVSFFVFFFCCAETPKPLDTNGYVIFFL